MSDEVRLVVIITTQPGKGSQQLTAFETLARHAEAAEQRLTLAIAQFKRDALSGRIVPNSSNA